MAIAALAATALSGCDPCEGARVRITGEDGETRVDVCAEVADSEAELRAGLAGRPSLAEGTGLLLVFPVTGEVCITGEGMEFALDVVFVDEASRVTAVGALGASDPELLCEAGVFRVLEIAKGAAEGVAPGDRVTIDRAPP